MSGESEYERLVGRASAEDLEAIHADAFDQLTPEQRDLLFTALVERAASDPERPMDATPAELARAASEAERRHPGTLADIASGRGASGLDPGLLNLYVGYAIGSDLAFGYLAAPDGFGGGFDGDGGFDGF